MDSIIAESWIALDSALLSKNVVVLSLEVADDLLEPECPSSERATASAFVFVKRYAVEFNIVGRTSRCYLSHFRSQVC